MRALLGWQADWKTAAVAAILTERAGAFIDVGANVGQSLLDFLSAPRRSSYVGFEPNPVCVQHLSGLIERNRLERCRIVPAGLSDKTGVSELYLFGGDATPGASTLRDLRPAMGARPVPIAVFRFDDLEASLGSPAIALVKIDVEGTELEVLRGMEAMLKARKPWVICEVLHRDANADPEAHGSRCRSLMQFVESVGYEVLRIVPADGAAVRALVPTGAFPERVWDDASANECDYLFVPLGETDLARRVLLSAGR